MIDHEKMRALTKTLRKYTGTGFVVDDVHAAADAIDLLLAEVEAANEKRKEAQLDAEKAREERNRVHVKLNAEWIEKTNALRAELEASKREATHWKANHDNQVARARVLIERTDMPLERVDAFKLIGNLRAELEAAAADKRGDVRHWTREDVQNKALEHGLKYWRAPDAHGVEGTKQQTVELLQDLLGVEVEIKDASQDQPWEIAGIDVPDDEREVMVFLNGDCALCDWDGRKGGGWGIRLGFYDHDKRYWRVHGCREDFVTHWRDLPDGPVTAVKNIAALAQRQGEGS